MRTSYFRPSFRFIKFSVRPRSFTYHHHHHQHHDRRTNQPPTPYTIRTQTIRPYVWYVCTSANCASVRASLRINDSHIYIEIYSIYTNASIRYAMRRINIVPSTIRRTAHRHTYPHIHTHTHQPSRLVALMAMMRQRVATTALLMFASFAVAFELPSHSFTLKCVSMGTNFILIS